ncbi:DUF2330 domain-containing protein [Micromonosporaceae bacterium Da 78-11]
MRRIAAAFATASLVGSLMFMAMPAQACACGAVITMTTDVQVDDETAVVRRDGPLEEVVMRLVLSGTPRDAAWVLPVPASPTFGLADDAIFGQLVQLTRPQEIVRTHWFGPGQQPYGAAASPSLADPVQLLDSRRVGPYEVATLDATDPAALSQWLSTHGYQLSPRLTEGVAPYVSMRWRYVAVKLSAAAGAFRRLARSRHAGGHPGRPAVATTNVLDPFRRAGRAQHGARRLPLPP